MSTTLTLYPTSVSFLNGKGVRTSDTQHYDRHTLSSTSVPMRKRTSTKYVGSYQLAVSYSFDISSLPANAIIQQLVFHFAERCRASFTTSNTNMTYTITNRLQIVNGNYLPDTLSFTPYDTTNPPIIPYVITSNDSNIIDDFLANPSMRLTLSLQATSTNSTGGTLSYAREVYRSDARPLYIEVIYDLPTPSPTNPTIQAKVSGDWVDGTIKAKVNGEWVDATALYIKSNGTWVQIE